MNIIDNPARITIHTDGACSGNPGPGGWGAIIRYWHGDELYERLEVSGGETATTNNRMELSAVCAALSYVTEMAALADALGITDTPAGFGTAVPITVHSDSEYVVKGFSVWLKGWKSKGWRTSAKEPVKNRELWEQLDEIATGIPVSFQWVRGHDGDPENEAADALARAAIPHAQAA